MKCLKLKETKGTWFCSNCSSVPKGEYACIFTCRSTYISILQMISPLVLMEIINKSLKKVQVGATLYNNDLSIIQVTSCFNLRSLKNLFSILRLLKIIVICNCVIIIFQQTLKDITVGIVKSELAEKYRNPKMRRNMKGRSFGVLLKKFNQDEVVHVYHFA